MIENLTERPKLCSHPLWLIVILGTSPLHHRLASGFVGVVLWLIRGKWIYIQMTADVDRFSTWVFKALGENGD